VKFAGGGLVAGLLLAGCGFLVPQPAVQEAPAQPAAIGPTLVLDVVNRRNQPILLQVEFDGANASGGAEGPVDACLRTPWTAEVTGRFEVLVDGAVVLSGVVPPEVNPGRVAFARIVVSADGEVAVTGPAWVGEVPGRGPEPIVGCA
jgi:hypothetical protein